MKLRYFEWCVLQHPSSDKEVAKTQTTEVVLPVTRELARDESELAMRIARQVPESYMEEAYRLEVSVRPF